MPETAGRVRASCWLRRRQRLPRSAAHSGHGHTEHGGAVRARRVHRAQRRQSLAAARRLGVVAPSWRKPDVPQVAARRLGGCAELGASAPSPPPRAVLGLPRRSGGGGSPSWRLLRAVPAAAHRLGACAPSWRLRAVLALGALAPLRWLRALVAALPRERAVPAAARRLGGCGPLRRLRAVPAAGAAARRLGGCGPLRRLRVVLAAAPLWRERRAFPGACAPPWRERALPAAGAPSWCRLGGRAPSQRMRAVLTGVENMVGEVVGARGASLGGPYGAAKAHCCVAVDESRSSLAACCVSFYQIVCLSVCLSGCTVLLLACRAGCAPPLCARAPPAPRARTVGPPVITPPGEGHTMHARCQ
eukprot:scaffold45361_cov59-Phaeocystis_antarctica.AAC.4